MNWLRRTLAGFALVAVALAGCGNDGNGSAPSAARGASFAGPVGGTDALVGLMVNPGDRRVMAYVCDGKAVGAWFSGVAEPDGAVDLTSRDGARLRGRIAGDELTGTVALSPGGPVHPFEAPAITAPAGLYRARGEVGGQPALGGWVVLADGRQKGGVRTSTGFIDLESDFARPDKPVTSFTETGADI